MSYTPASPDAQDQSSNPTPQPPAARERGAWPLVVGVSVVGLALLLALLFLAWWYFGFAGWFD
jgi:hypothetical protein